MKISEIRDKVITGSFAIGKEGMKEPCSALGMDDWEFYAKRLEYMVSIGEFTQPLEPITEEEIRNVLTDYGHDDYEGYISENNSKTIAKAIIEKLNR